VNLSITILVCIVNASLAFILDDYIGFSDDSNEWIIENAVIIYYSMAITAESLVIIMLHKFTVSHIVTLPLILVTFIMAVSHTITFFLIIFGYPDSDFVQLWYNNIICAGHASYVLPIMIGIFDAIAEKTGI